MYQHIVSGKKGEKLAGSWLSAKGFAILACNWRHGRHEVDIIASRQDVLHFIEVKFRHSTMHGNPEEIVSKQKIRHIMRASIGWLENFPTNSRVQFDVLSITECPGQPPEFFLIEDVYL